jgi:DNA mismatch endonuclease (patch repair protein)
MFIFDAPCRIELLLFDWQNPDVAPTMTDTRTKEKRSKIMSAVRSKDTAPELIVRRLVFGMGYRYRLYDKKLPGKPDLVLAGKRKIILVNGCFWHGHENCRYGRLPKSRLEFWRSKIDRNRLRDAKNLERLTASGWAVLTVWQCEIKNMETLRQKIHDFLES